MGEGAIREKWRIKTVLKTWAYSRKVETVIMNDSPSGGMAKKTSKNRDV